MEERTGLWSLQHEDAGQVQSANGHSSTFVISGYWPVHNKNIVMCEPTSCGTLVHIHNKKCFIYIRLVFHYIKACKHRICDFAHFFFICHHRRCTGNFLLIKHAHHRRKRVARGTEGQHQSGWASSHLGGHVLEEFNLPLDQLWARLGAIACAHTPQFQKKSLPPPIWGRNPHRHPRDS